MTWKYVGAEKGLHPDGIFGIGAGPFEDKEFDELVHAYEEYHSFPRGSVKKGGLYEHVADSKAAAKEGDD